MKLFRHLCSFFAAGAFAAAAFAADAAGTWKWKIETPNGEVETTLTLALKDGKLAGNYSNSYGATAVATVSFKDDQLAFAVEREVGGNKFTLKFSGKVEGDAIKGEIEVPGTDGGAARKIEWNAKRVKP